MKFCLYLHENTGDFWSILKKCHVSFKIVATSFMYLILSPVSAQVKAGLWQIQWKFGITLLILLNRAATPLYSPVMILAPLLTTDFRFLTSKLLSFGDRDLTSDDLSICTLAGIYTLGWQELFQPQLFLG